MKLSEAIREGCKLRPRKCFGSFLDQDDGACVLGAASVGAGANPYSWPVRYNLEKLFPELADDGDMNLFEHLTFLNDFTSMTREEIADELEGKGL